MTSRPRQCDRWALRITHVLIPTLRPAQDPHSRGKKSATVGIAVCSDHESVKVRETLLSRLQLILVLSGYSWDKYTWIYSGGVHLLVWRSTRGKHSLLIRVAPEFTTDFRHIIFCEYGSRSSQSFILILPLSFDGGGKTTKSSFSHSLKRGSLGTALWCFEFYLPGIYLQKHTLKKGTKNVCFHVFNYQTFMWSKTVSCYSMSLWCLMLANKVTTRTAQTCSISFIHLTPCHCVHVSTKQYLVLQQGHSMAFLFCYLLFSMVPWWWSKLSKTF